MGALKNRRRLSAAPMSALAAVSRSSLPSSHLPLAQTKHAAPLPDRLSTGNDIRRTDIDHDPCVRLAYRAICRDRRQPDAAFRLGWFGVVGDYFKHLSKNEIFVITFQLFYIYAHHFSHITQSY